jgi:DDE family transposase
MDKYSEGVEASQAVNERLVEFVRPLLERLDERIDKRLVRTFLGLLQVILVLRHNRYGLLLSELGGYLLGVAHAPAGTKRISNLLRSPRWQHAVVGDYLWQQAERHVQELLNLAAMALVVWDESIIEKPESIAAEGLCAVRSAKAHRLSRIKKGFYNPPTGKPTFVPGYNWLLVMVLGMAGTPTLAAMRFWTRRGEQATERTAVVLSLLQQAARLWGKQVVHLFDRGYASGPWLAHFFDTQICFIVRWRNSYHLQDAKGRWSPGEMCRGKRSLEHRLLWDARRRCERKVGILYFPVLHPQHPHQPLWLVVARPHQRPAWHFLTNQSITSTQEAWQVLYAYARRWQIETAFRFFKSELALESPRLWSWHNRLKLFAIVALVYAFLLSLLAPAAANLCQSLLKHFCPRTGKRHRLATMPLYRLRSAIARLCLAYPVSPVPLWLNSG